MLLNNKSTDFKKLFYLFLFVAILIRVVTASSFDFGVDEAHYALYGLHPALSYFDHPPMVGWVQYFFSSLFGENELAFRVAAILSSIIVSIFIFNFIKRKFESEKIAFFSVLALNASIILDGLFMMLLPENILFVVIFPIIYYTIEILKNNSLKNYIILGLFLGLAGLGKYTAVLFIPPILLFILIKKRVDLFFNFKFLLLILIALIMISPVVMWNMQNDWISFSYQSSHVVGSNSINFKSFSKNLIGQIVAFTPFLSIFAFYGVYKALKSKDDELILTSLVGSFIFLFFVYSSLYKNTLPHWNSLFYLLLLPIGIAYFFQQKEKIAKVLIYISLFLVAFLHAELTFKFLPLKDYKSLHRDIYGWKEIVKKASKYGNNIAVSNWTLASRALYYGRKEHLNLYLIDKRYDQFDIWQKNRPEGKDLIFINTHFFSKKIDDYVTCEKISPLEKFDIKLHGNIVNSIELTLCKNFKTIK